MLYKKPSNIEKLRNENLVIGYFKGKAIVKNDRNLLFFIECDECHAPEGTYVENEALTSIRALPEKERKEIEEIFVLWES